VRTLSAPLATHIEGETISLCTLWRVALLEGTVLGFTDHDANILLDGLTYAAASGFTASAIDTTAALNVDNMDVDGMLVSPSITDDDLISGRWDYAAIKIMMINWRDLSAGVITLRVGRLGEVSAAGSKWKAEIRGLMQALQTPIGQIYQPGCRANFGDARCKFDVSTVTTLCTVSAISADGRVLFAPELTLPPGLYDGGKVAFLTGLDHGLVGEVKRNDVGWVELHLPMPLPVQVGDAFNATQGCLKRPMEDCKARYNNIINFRGEPYLPGTNRMVKGAPVH
jgi:uncharacterized phage protein (TIGR02218 family)